MYVLVTYDVSDKRTEVFRKILGTYLQWEQNSVFSGNITPSLFKKMLAEIGKASRESDRFLFVEADNRHNVRVVSRTKSGKNGLFAARENNTHITNSQAV